MKTRLYRILLMVIIFVFTAASIGCHRKSETNILLLPSLPNPIAKEEVMITSVGQSTDAYILRDIANQLMIRNYFMPQARETDLAGIHTLVFIVGYSPFGAKFHDISLEDEIQRTQKLLKKSQDNNITIITVYLGGKQRRGKETDKLLKLLAPATDYLIATKESNYDGFLAQLAKKDHIPISLVNETNDISGPFASAFR